MRFDELYVGQFASISKKFSDKDVLDFANLCMDHNPIHLDHEYAKNTIFGKPIIHGMLIGGLVSAVLGTMLPGEGSILLEQTLKYIKPVYYDETIGVTCSVDRLIPEKNLVVLDIFCTKEDDEIVAIGEAKIKFKDNKNE